MSIYKLYKNIFMYKWICKYGSPCISIFWHIMACIYYYFFAFLFYLFISEWMNQLSSSTEAVAAKQNDRIIKNMEEMETTEREMNEVLIETRTISTGS